jgi:hypothetical protein
MDIIYTILMLISWGDDRAGPLCAGGPWIMHPPVATKTAATAAGRFRIYVGDALVRSPYAVTK